MNARLVFGVVAALFSAGGGFAAAGRPVIIAHRGASGYLPEHTLEAKAMAYGQEADFIEQDVALTKDGIPVVCHDHHLDTVSDVAMRFPGRQRSDGRFYVIDFTFDEIRTLRLFERIDLQTGERVYPGRFPQRSGVPFRMPSLEEEIQLIQGLNASTGRNVGLYVELKAPWFHRREGQDIAAVVVALLMRYGYVDRSSNVYLQCFDPECLRQIRFVMKSRLKLVQLIAENEWDETPGVDYEAMLTAEGIAGVARYADGIGPHIPQIVHKDQRGRVVVSPVVASAQRLGMVVHPYTLRMDRLPANVKTHDEALRMLFRSARVDGVFTDFPDMGVRYLRRRRR